MKALITGISGFAGTYLTDRLLNEGYEVSGTVKPDAIEKRSERDDVSLYGGDLLDQKFIAKVINKTVPDIVFHLASYTSPAKSFSIPYETITNNIGITVNLLEALKNTHTKILLVGSADEYGIVKDNENPISEANSFRPTNPYAVSKIAQDFLGLQYFLSHGMNIVRVRPGNQIGPMQRPDFVVAAFAEQIAKAEYGYMDPIINVGNLESIRDFTDVRDMVDAYVLAILHGKIGEVYNLGSQKGIKIREILDKLIKLAKIKFEVRIDPARSRPADTPKLIIDSSKFRNLTGWKPKISIDQSLEDILDYWRLSVKK